jgi:hypothetical protein
MQLLHWIAKLALDAGGYGIRMDPAAGQPPHHPRRRRLGKDARGGDSSS